VPGAGGKRAWNDRRRGALARRLRGLPVTPGRAGDDGARPVSCIQSPHRGAGRAGSAGRGG
jgi:hypothetical protein